MKAISQASDLTAGTVWKVLLKFAFPIFLGTLFQGFYAIADAFIVGRFAGRDSLAAIESVYTLIKMPVNFFVGLSSGATVIISKYFGAKKLKEVSEASHNAVLFGFWGGLVLSAIAIILSPTTVRLVRVPSEIASEARRYLNIYYSGMSLSMLYNMGAGILRALGNSKTPFYYLVIANVTNIFLDYLFIAGLHMGAEGAAIATVIAQGLSAILLVAELLRTRLVCRISCKKLRFHAEHLRNIFRLGLPLGLQNTLFPISNTVVLAKINNFGVNSIAAWSICGKLDFLIWYVAEAFGNAISTFIAQNYGARKYERAKKGVKYALLMPILILVAVSGALYIWSEVFAQILVKDADVIKLTAQIIRFLAPTYVFYIFCEVLPGVIRGTAETFKPMIITLLGICASRILWVLLVVPLRSTLFTVLACYPISWILTSIMFAVFYLKNTAKKFNITP